jgi:hypothetical protein
MYRKKIEDFTSGVLECKSWLENKYDGLTENEEWNEFGLKDIHIICNGKRCGHYPKGSPRYMNGKRIKIGLRRCDFYLSYCKKLEYLSPIGGIPIDRYDGYKVCLIHELTHFVQQLQNRNNSEKETTKNELEYLIEIKPFYEHQLISYEERKQQELKYKEYRKLYDRYGNRK